MAWMCMLRRVVNIGTVSRRQKQHSVCAVHFGGYQGRPLRPDDAGVVKVEFSPASRLFGSGSLIIGGGTSRSTGLTDNDLDDPVIISTPTRTTASSLFLSLVPKLNHRTPTFEPICSISVS